MTRRLHSFVLVTVGLLVFGACASSSGSGSATPSPTDAANSGGVAAGYRTDTDELSPLVITALAPDPIPVTGTDGRVHVVYGPCRFSTLRRCQPPLSGSRRSRADLTARCSRVCGTRDRGFRTLLVGAPNFGVVAEIPGGRAGILLADDVYPTRADVPGPGHSPDRRFRGARTKEASLSNYFPMKATDVGGAVTTSDASPVVISPPLAGDAWLAGNGCCTFSSHRGVMMPFSRYQWR